MAHGFARTTVDIDLLICREDRAIWQRRATASEFNIFFQTDTFIQLTHQEDRTGLDLMMVDKKTFLPMYEASIRKEVKGVKMRIPCLDHLLALKLHAAKNAKGLRSFKDLQDIEMLARKNHLSLEKTHYRKLFQKYGTEDIYNLMLKGLKNED